MLFGWSVMDAADACPTQRDLRWAHKLIQSPCHWKNSQHGLGSILHTKLWTHSHGLGSNPMVCVLLPYGLESKYCKTFCTSPYLNGFWDCGLLAQESGLWTPIFEGFDVIEMVLEGCYFVLLGVSQSVFWVSVVVLEGCSFVPPDPPHLITCKYDGP